MPLLASVLQAEILKITDEHDAGFVGQSIVLSAGAVDMLASNDKAAQFWANAASVYMLGISVPPGAVAMVPAAVATFKSTFFGLLGVPGGGAAALAAAFTAAAGVLATAPPPVAIPPAVPLMGLIAAALAPFAAVGITDPKPPAAATAAAIDGWFKTGLWGPPPAPPASPWT